MKITISILILISSIFITNAQDVLFTGLSLRGENTSLGLNLGIKKDFGKFGIIGQFNLYPYTLERKSRLTESYYTYKDFTISGIYPFNISDNITLYPIVGLAANLVRRKAMVRDFREPEIDQPFTKGKTQSSIGGTFGIGGIYAINDQWNIISDLRYDATNYTSLKFMIGAAFNFGSSEKAN